MQAQFEIRRSPKVLISVLFALAVALILGGSLGYLLKPAHIVSSPSRVIVVSGDAGASGTSDATLDQCFGPSVCW